jgi:hypothetical protein
MAVADPRQAHFLKTGEEYIKSLHDDREVYYGISFPSEALPPGPPSRRRREQSARSRSDLKRTIGHETARKD